jgi:hypothetical protein
MSHSSDSGILFLKRYTCIATSTLFPRKSMINWICLDLVAATQVLREGFGRGAEIAS